MKFVVKSIGLWIVTLTVVFMFSASTWACDVAVVSGLVTPDGRPLIWKNRDDSYYWEEAVKYYSAKYPCVGGSIRVIQTILLPSFDVSSGGVNDAGFAIANTTVYDPNLINEVLNLNVELMNRALEECVTVEDFEALLGTWHETSPGNSGTISGNFTAIDAYGGAAMYEAYTVDGVGGKVHYVKFDANKAEDEEGNFIGFVNRTNSHQWIIHSDGWEREVRAYDIMHGLALAGELTYCNVMQEVARDICGDVTKDNPESFHTKLCISRAQTRTALVVNGVKHGEDPRLSTMWVNLGEPSIGMFVPLFSYAGGVPYYVRAKSLGTCLINWVIFFRELLLYDNNGLGLIPIDYTINYSKLQGIQEYSIAIEDFLIDKTKEYLGHMRGDPEWITYENLFDFSKECVKFAYKNYFFESFDYYDWDFTNPWDVEDTGWSWWSWWLSLW